MEIDDQHRSPPALNKVMEEIQGKPEQNVLEQLGDSEHGKSQVYHRAKGPLWISLCTLFSFHLTKSGRYPDMMVHRLLWGFIWTTGKSPLSWSWRNKKCVPFIERGKARADAERASIKYKQWINGLLAEVKDYDGSKVVSLNGESLWKLPKNQWRRDDRVAGLWLMISTNLTRNIATSRVKIKKISNFGETKVVGAGS